MTFQASRKGLAHAPKRKYIVYTKTIVTRSAKTGCSHVLAWTNGFEETVFLVGSFKIRNDS
jgi:hypothetical protein